MIGTFIEPDPFTAALVQGIVILAVLRALDVWEREPVAILAVLALCGAAGATGLATVGNAAIESLLAEDVEIVWGPALSAPVVEELAKGLCVVAALYVTRYVCRHFGLGPMLDGPTDGMVYGAAVGLGFAFSENNLAFLNEAYTTAGREVLGYREGFLNLNTLGHAVYTGVFGAALGLATWTASAARRAALVAGGFAVAVLMHALHNGLTSFVLVNRFGLDDTAAFQRNDQMPLGLLTDMEDAHAAAGTALRLVDYALSALFVAAIVGWAVHQRRVLARELDAEIARGTMSVEERGLVVHLGRRAAAYARLLRAGRLREFLALRARNRELVALAFDRWRARAQSREAIQRRSSSPAAQA